MFGMQSDSKPGIQLTVGRIDSTLMWMRGQLSDEAVFTVSASVISISLRVN